mmetsp:Transcript_82545/g.136539  ORF Transcript_82545/g.136539 Transcript_82545/m.136539 type:complete len:193 (-) Transcript_82545:24-602(-)
MGIIKMYDHDDNGVLNKDELKPLLADFSEQCLNRKHEATDDEFEFILNLCDKEGGGEMDAGDGKIDKKEVMQVIHLWSDWMKERDHMHEIFKESTKDGNISVQVLEGIFADSKPDFVATVPPEVVQWAFAESDLNKSNSLEPMELARSMRALEKWWNKDVEYPPEPFAKYIKKPVGSLPEPVFVQSVCCVVS